MIKRFTKWIIAIVAVSSLLSSCHKSDDSDDADPNYDDPRVRVVSIKGISKTFIINDYEEAIFNYDSLAFGTQVSKLHPTFSGYSVITKIFYEKDGKWIKYPQADTSYTLDFTKDVKIRSYSVDSLSYKDYTFSIRIHNYDVDSYEWIKQSALPISDEITTYKCIFYNGKYYFFYSDKEGANFVSASSDLKTWSKPTAVSAPDADWSTLCTRGSELAVLCGSDLYVASIPTQFIKSEPQTPAGYTFKRPLFSIDNTFLALATDADGKLAIVSLPLGKTNYELCSSLNEEIDTDKITTCVSPSGITNVGYIFTPKDENSTNIFAVDNLGNVINMTQNSTPFGYDKNMIVFYYGDLLCVAGSKAKEGQNEGIIWSSEDFGKTWVADPHKALPNEITDNAASIIAESSTASIYYIGTKNVWKGVLKQYLLDEKTYGK